MNRYLGLRVITYLYLGLNILSGCFWVLFRDAKSVCCCQVVGREAGALLAAHYRVDGQPHLNPLRDVLIGSRHMYLIFPTSHGDLHSYVRHKGNLGEDEARRLFRQMAVAVRTCHDAGIVLKDLKLRKFVFADIRR